MTKSQAKDGSIRQGVAKGAAWTLAANLGDRFLGVFSLAVLARLLTPSDFGLVSIAFTAVAALDAFSAFGFDWALVRHPDLQNKHMNTAWTIRVIVGFGVFVVLLLLAVPVSRFFHEPRLKLVVVALGVSKVVQSMENIGMVLYRREFLFEKEFALQFWSRATNLAVSIPAAFLFRSYWALIAGILATRVGGVVASYMLHPFRPRLSMAAKKELFGFSIWLQLNSALNMLRERSSDFILGRTVGPHGVAIFAMSHEIANLATTELAAPINRAVFSGYSKLTNDVGRLREAYMSVAAVIWLVALPVAAGIACTAPQIVVVFLGHQWAEAIPVLQFLALGGFASVMAANSQFVFLTLGKPFLNTGISLITVAVLLPSVIILATRMGVRGAALAFAMTTIAVLPVIFTLLRKLIGLRLGEFLSHVYRPLCATAVMTGVVMMIRQPPSQSGLARDVLSLLLMSTAGVLVYGATLLLLWIASGRPKGSEVQMVGLVFTPLRNLINRRADR